MFCNQNNLLFCNQNLTALRSQIKLANSLPISSLLFILVYFLFYVLISIASFIVETTISVETILLTTLLLEKQFGAFTKLMFSLCLVIMS